MVNNSSLVIAAAQKYLSVVKTTSIDDWMDIWAEDAVVEFPYSQNKFSKRLEGKNAIYQYYKNISPAFKLLEEKTPVAYLSSDPLVAVFEISMKFYITSTGKEYNQDYIAVIRIRDDGKIICYREYCDPIRALEAFKSEKGDVV